MSAQDYDSKEIDVWPDNWSSVDFFLSVSTQWRTGMGGATGLDYSGVYAALKMQRIKKNRWQKLLDDLAVMEVEALKAMKAKDDGG